MSESYILWLQNEMSLMEKKIKELDPEIDHWLFAIVEQRLEYIYKRIASNTK